MEKRIFNTIVNALWGNRLWHNSRLERLMLVLFVCCSGSFALADTEMQNSLLSYPVRISFGRAWGTSVKGQYLAPGENKVYKHGYSLDRVSAEYSVDPDAYWQDSKGRYRFNPNVEWRVIGTITKGFPWWTAKQAIVVYPVLDVETGAVTPQLSVSGGT